MRKSDDLLARSRRASTLSAELAERRRLLAGKLKELNAERNRLGAELASSVRTAFRIQGQIAARAPIRDSQAKIREELKFVESEIARRKVQLASLPKAA
jgi:hypothetical protein